MPRLMDPGVPVAPETPTPGARPGFGDAIQPSRPGFGDETYHALDTVEDASASTLPTDITLTLAQSVNTDELRKASILIARKLDFAPTFLLKPAAGRPGFSDPIGEFKDPITGGVVSLATARRLLKPLQIPVMRSMLRHVFNDVSPEEFGTTIVNGVPKLRRIASGLPPTPERVSSAVAALAPLEGDTFAWSDALGAAIQIARTDLNLPLFSANLDVARRIPNVTPMQSIALAHLAAARGLRFHDMTDVLTFAYPESAAPLEQAKTIQALQQRASTDAGNYFGTDPHRAAMVEFQQQYQLGAGSTQEAQPGGLAGERLETSTALASGLLAGDVRQTAGDYLRMAKLIAERARIDQSHFQETFAYKAIAAIGGALNTAYNRTAGAFWAGRAAVSQADNVAVSAGLKPGAVTDVSRELSRQLEVARMIDSGRETIGQAFVADWHLPSWSTPIVDLAFAFELDPTIIAGKVMSIARASRFLGEIPGALSRGTEAAGIADKVNDFLNKPLRALRWTHLGSGQSVPEYLVRQMFRSADSEKFYLSAVSRFRAYRATEGIDRVFAAHLYDVGHAMRAAGHSVEDVVGMAKEAMSAAFGANPGGLGARLNAEREAIDRALRERQYEDIYARYGAGGLSPDRAKEIADSGDALTHTRDEAWLLAAMDDLETPFLTGPRIMHEIPHFRATTDLMRALGRTRLADTSAGGALAATFNKTPRALFDLEGLGGPGFDEQMGTYLKRWRGMFTQQEIAAARLDAARIVGMDHGVREAAFGAIVPKYERMAMLRLAKEAGFSETDAKRLADEIGGLTSGTNHLLAQSRLYGIISVEDPATGIEHSLAARRPIATTQLLNKMAAVDPLVARRALYGNALSVKRMANGVRRVFGKEVRPLIENGELAPKLVEALKLDRAYSGWKQLVVTRPAYVTRVVWLDENLRYSATLGLFSHIESTRTGARVLSLADRVTGRVPRTVTVEGPEGPITVEFRRPGLTAHDPAISVGTKDRAWQESMSEEQRRILQMLKGTGGFDGLTKDAPNFLTEWSRDLNDQFGRAPEFGPILTAIAHGGTAEEGAAEAVRLLRSDKEYAALAKSLDLTTPEAEEAWGHYAGRVIAEYTGNDPVIARAALSHTVDADMLRSLPEDRWPERVHGAELQIVKDKRASLPGRLWENYRSLILEKPTNAMNRHPYFRAWNEAMRYSLLDQARVEGRVVDDLLRSKIDEEAARFARGQVSRIMFDMRDQGRLGEMLKFVVPFFQPWAEAFTVWGRIIQENPALVGYAYEAIHQGIDSGFLKRDPDTGQLVVPMSNWMAAAPLLSLAFSGPGWQLSAPLSGFNLFFNTTLPIPTGKIAGELPLPFPGFAPPFQILLQKLAEDDKVPMSTRLWLASWVFQNGPTVASTSGGPGGGPLEALIGGFVPRWMQYAADALGFRINDSQVTASENDFLRLMELHGIHPRTDEPPPDLTAGDWATMDDPTRVKAWQTWMASRARGQARAFFGHRAWISAFFPAAPKIDFPYRDKQRELDDLRKPPADGGLGFEKGTEQFIRQNPGLELLTIANAVWNKDLGHSAVPIPATKAVQQIMSTPYFAKFARSNPQWAWAIIPSEARNGEFDLGVYSAFVASDVYTMRSPEQVLEEGDRQAGWNAYFAARAQHDARETRFLDENRGPGDPLYDHEAARWRTWLDDAKRVHPDWGADYNSFDQSGMDPSSFASARAVLQNPVFAKTQTAAWLRQYIPRTMAIFHEMQAHGIRSLNSKAAQNLGLPKRYADMVKTLNREFPDGKLAYQAFFSDNLTVPVTSYDRSLGRLTPDQLAHLGQFSARWHAALDAPAMADPGPEKLQAFLDIRTMADRAFSAPGPNELMFWWHSRSDDQRTAYLQNLMGRPYEFLSRFDRQVVLGEKTTDSAEQRWLNLAQDQLAIAKARDENPLVPAAPMYAALDKVVDQWVAADPAFAAQIQHANEWGWTIRQALPTVVKGSDSQPYWSAFLDDLRTVQVAVDSPVGTNSLGQPVYLHGPDIDIDPKKKAAWVLLKKALTDERDRLFAESPQFRREWDQLEQLNGYDSLIDYLVPNTYFPVGGYALAPKAAA